MAAKLILRGLLVGAIAGLLALAFTRIFAEPVINRAIDYESARDEAQHALDKAAGLPVDEHGHDIFSRTIQANLGIGVGMILFGAAVGTLFAVVYTVSLGRVGALRPRTLAVLVAGGGFLALYLVPFLAYPANPPAIGHKDTIKERSVLYLLMVAAAIVFLAFAVLLGKRLTARFGHWNAPLIAAAAYVVVIGAATALLPSFGMLATNVQHYGAQATETPLPLLDTKGTIVFPGFPADDLIQFRLYSVGAQLVLWAAIGLLFAPLAHRVLEPTDRLRQASGDREKAAV
ncbi:CbtA family protein [Nakamurella sp. UYEF19]|uniref:CbtA family protein n=1 Tax=Nakamurella sp. UYEF19 TaxID=1756392 RepID=UPI00339AB7B9